MEIPKLPLAVVNVVVALPVPKKKSPPESEISPATSSLVEGEVLPMPRLPPCNILIFSPALVEKPSEVESGKYMPVLTDV